MEGKKKLCLIFEEIRYNESIYHMLLFLLHPEILVEHAYLYCMAPTAVHHIMCVMMDQLEQR